jgi:hypothetical protein
MNQAATCPTCARTDPVSVVDWLCLAEGRFHANCLLGHQATASSSMAADAGKAKLEAAFLELQARLGTTDTRYRKNANLWKIVALIGTLLGGAAGGLWFHGTAPVPGPDVTARQALNEDDLQRHKLRLQLELAQSCLDAGLVECAAHLVEPIAQADPSNSLAKKIKADVAARRARSADSSTDKLDQNALLPLAEVSLEYGYSCLRAKKVDCARRSATLVLQSIPENYPPGRPLRQRAAMLSKETEAGETYNKAGKTPREAPPKVPIK